MAKIGTKIDTRSAVSHEESFVLRLARFFPSATQVRIPVSVYIMGDSTNGEHEGVASSQGEETVIEFGTDREVIFASSLPLEFDDKVRLMNGDGSLNAEASVVAVQLGMDKSAVAVRFTENVSNWIIKPA